jgi:8-oxo-dGTP diphosphatase
MIRVVNAIIVQNGRVLLIKRAGGIHAGKWAFPGGVVEREETDERALVREVKEETNLDVEKIIKKVADYDYPRENHETSKGTSYLVSARGKLKTNKEIEDAKFFELEELENTDIVEGIEEEAMNALYGKK